MLNEILYRTPHTGSNHKHYSTITHCYPYLDKIKSIQNDYDETKELSKIIRELADLKEQQKISENQFLYLMKFLVAMFVENKIMDKIYCAFDKSLSKL